jgi:hypothetical protein
VNEEDILAKYSSATPEQDASGEQDVLAKYAPENGAPQSAPTGSEADILNKYTPDQPAAPASPAEKPTDNHTPSILEAFAQGVRKSVDPFHVSTEDLKKEEGFTRGEKIAEAVGNIGTDIGTSVGLGALAGSAVPGAGNLAGATVGLGLGIYRALGYEDMHTRQTGEAFNPLRAGLNIATEVNPVLRLGGKMTKFVSQGALQALQSLAYGGDGQDAAVAALLGGSLGAIGHHGMEPGELKAAGIASLIVPPEAGPNAMEDMTKILTDNGTRELFVQRAVNAISESEPTTVEKMVARPGFFQELAEGKNIQDMASQMKAEELKDIGVDVKLVSALKDDLRKAGASTDESTLTRMAKETAVLTKIEDGAEDVARFLTRDYELTGPELFTKADQTLRAMGMSGEDAVQMVRFQRALNQATEEGVEELRQWGRVPKDPLDNTLLRSVSDQKYAARMSDRTTGLDLEPKFAQVSVAKYRKNQFVFQFAKRANELTKEGKAAGLSRMQISTLLESGEESWGKLSDEAKGVLGGFRTLFNDARDQAKGAGIDIGWLDNYVTAVAKDPADYVTAVRREVRQYIRNNGQVDGSIFQNEELLGVLARARGEQIKTKKDVLAALNALEDPTVLKGRVGFEGNAAFEREGALPDFLREKDIGKIVMVYANNLGNAMYMDPAIRQLEIRVPALKTLGQKNTADWLETQIKRLSGQKSGFMQWLSNSEVKFKTSIDELMDVKDLSKWQVAGLKAARFAPDLLSWGVSQIYPNMLGFNPKAVIRNLAQVQLVSAGDVGGVYGQKLGVKAMLSTIRDKSRGVDLQDTLMKLGYHPGEHIGEGMNALHNALESTLVGPLVRSSDAIGKVGMKIYGQTDSLNRYATLKMAEMITSDLTGAMQAGAKATGDQQAALKFLKKLPPGYKNEIYADLKAGKSPLKGIAEYLISSTQFDYGPQALSEFGQTFGRFATMFTKWPAMVMGDVHDLVTSGQTAKAMTKYLAPLMALGAMDLYLKDTKDNVRLRSVLGKSMTDWSPLMSMKVSQPPVLQIAGGMAKSFADAVSFDFRGAGAEALHAMDPIMPFNSLRLGAVDKLYFNLFKNQEAPHPLQDALRKE